ncbi:MAG: type II secretion system F family protein [Candidatus Ryanbacteria bacterium]|nr:type II secretion system F family protein [Candidatus Ryanbacteria bacterium]
MAQQKTLSRHSGGGRSASLATRALFAKHLAVMLKSGLTLTEALQVTRDSSRGAFRGVLTDIMRAVETGRPLSQAFGDHERVFGGLFIEATYAGEKSGTLPENLENIATELEREKELVAKVKGALMYPSVVLVAAFVLAMGVSFFVLPKITPLFESFRVELPFATRALIGFSHFVSDYGYYFFGGMFGLILLLTWMVRQKFSHPFTHLLMLRVPIIGTMIRSANIARFVRTLGMLLKSGVNVDEAIEIARDAMGNYYYKLSLTRVGRDVAKGSKLSESLAQEAHLFPAIVTRMIKVGEESGKFEETLFYLASFYEAEVDTSTKTLSTVLEPLLLLFIGLLVGGLALAIITPIYEITGGIKY